MASDISVHNWTLTLQGPAGGELQLEDGTATLDQGWSPYGVIRVTVKTPASIAMQDALDPRTSPVPRITVTAAVEPLRGSVAASARTFDLQVREREIDRKAGTTDLMLSTDEGSLLDLLWMGTEANAESVTHKGSLRAIVNNILAKVGAALEPGGPDASFFPLIRSTNEITNPCAGASLASWGSSGLTSLVRQGPGLTWVQNASGTAFRLNGGNSSVDSYAQYSVPASDVVRMRGKWLRYSGLFHQDNAQTGTAGADARRLVAFTRTPDGVYTKWQAPQPPNLAATTFKSHVDVLVPDNGTEILLRLYHGHVGLGSLYFSDLRLSEATIDEEQDVDFFDGDTTDTAEYTYAWSSTADLSTSTRTPVLDRPVELLAWEVGESAWDFLEPLLTVNGMRLFADEQRKWRLVDESYFVDGLVTVAAGVNATEGSERISRNDDSLTGWADAIAVEYSWRDAAGVDRVVYDVASEPGYTRGRLVKYARPYPGPGAAQYLLRRSLGQGRVMDVQAVSAFHASPNMSATVSMPDAETQTGYVSRVEWDMGTDRMQVGTTGLTDTPVSAWALIPFGEAWEDSPPGGTWANEVV